MTSPYPKTMELLRAEGLDSSLITVEGINEGSYLEIVLDENGKKILNPSGSLAAVRRAWPRPGLGEEVMQAMIEDMRGNASNFRVLDEESGDLLYPIDNVVLLRRRYDMDPTEENARAYLDAENRLSEDEFPAYMALYRKVSDDAETKASEDNNIKKG